MDVAYRSDRAVLYHGDARKVLASLDDESIDCVVTDPPYEVEWQSNARNERFAVMDGDEHGDGLLASCANDLVRVTRRSRHLYTFGVSIEHPLMPVKSRLVWDKGRVGGGDLSCPWGPSHESIYFHYRAADKTNARKQAGALAARLRRGSVISVRRLSALQVGRHPTEKPVRVLRQLIESSSVLDELVLDPFVGVGSTMVAALIEGRRTIGIEIDETYCSIAAERIAAAESALRSVESL